MSQPSASDKGHWTADIVAGFLVFLIALPLCLGIAMASSFPPIAGIFTAVVGGLVATFLGSGRLTIKGPAAGLIVIAFGAVTELGQGDAQLGYRLTLATIVVAAVLQIALAVAKAGVLGELFPAAVVHGMLAAIGVIICSKQAHTLLGVTPEKAGPLKLLAQIPRSVAEANPEVALIGVLSLVVLFGWPKIPSARVRKIPPQLVVVILSMLLGSYFELGREHHYQLRGRDFSVGPRFLVELPGQLLSAIAFPDFSQVLSATSLKYIVMFALVGSIESLLSAKAVDSLDPLKRRSDLDRDLFATGAGNLVAGMIGGLPMISEIVRSSANITSGARTRWANFFHGAFLLVFVTAVPWLLARIPLAALAAMLIYTGVRLASPSEVARAWQIGREQLVIFVTTLVVTVATDLVVGGAAGIALKIVLHWRNGMPIRSVFRPEVNVETSGDDTIIHVGQSAIFSNYLSLKRVLSGVPMKPGRVVLDLAKTKLVDHTVMEKLHERSENWRREGRELVVQGLDEHEPASPHPQAARRRKKLSLPVVK